MTIFVILMPQPQPSLVDVIKRVFPNDSLPVTDTQWLISTTGTVVELTATLGIYDAKEPEKPPTGNAIIFAISAYFGRAPTSVRDWIKTKWEASSGG
jgi:hypothetical protein